MGDPANFPADLPLTIAEAHRLREWFNCVQDTHPGYLEREDFELARRIYAAVGMKESRSFIDDFNRSQKGSDDESA